MGQLVQFLFVIALNVFAARTLQAASLPESGIRIYQRLAGVPPSALDRIKIEEFEKTANIDGIAQLAMKNRGFYLGNVKYFASKMSNVSDLSAIELNDFSGTLIGMVRDNVPLNQALYEDILYIGNVDIIRSEVAPFNVTGNKLILEPYGDMNNNHYSALDKAGVDLSNPNYFIRVKQSDYSLVPADYTMGVMTTHSAGEAFLKAGTNRRMVRFSFVNFLCRDMEQLQDNTVPDHRVRQDVPRSAGGDSSTYITKCSGCHAGMDGLAGAFAEYDFITTRAASGALEERVAIFPTVVSKYFRNNFNYPSGYVTRDDGWVNLWENGQNASIGWRTNAEVTTIKDGKGAKSLGKMLSATTAFSSCWAQRAFAQVCNRSAPFTSVEKTTFAKIGQVFEKQNYNGKALFAEAVKYCTVVGQ